ncbi:MAG TPA: ECF-type sigma factor [Acidobacteriaceae bacterium]|nr:ECF-type sigma factor [Acidobacteriaceae bacterium]
MIELGHLLAAARSGDAQAANRIFTLLYRELRQLAHAKLRQHQEMTLLDTTCLLHESYLRLLGGGGMQVVDRSHFFAYAARVMRSVIVDFARARLAQRRGGDRTQITLNADIVEGVGSEEDTVIQVHEALDALGQVHERLAQVVEMRYFGGLTEKEIADVLGVSERTIKRDWERARLLLFAALR